MRLPTQPNQLNARVVGGGAFRRANGGVRPSVGEVKEMSRADQIQATVFGNPPKLCRRNEQLCMGAGANDLLYVCCPNTWRCGTDNNGRPYCRLRARIQGQITNTTQNSPFRDAWNQILSYIT